MELRNIAYAMVISILTVVILIAGKDLLIPFVFALLLWFVVGKIKMMLDKVGFIRNWLPSWVKSVIGSVVIILVVAFLSQIISSNINALIKSFPKYEANISLLINKINLAFDVNLIEMMYGQMKAVDIGRLFTTVFNSFTDFLGSTFMVILYALFIFLEEAHFETKLQKIFSRQTGYRRVMAIIRRIEISIADYMGLKTLISLVTGVLSFTVLWMIGVDSPVFWAFLIFLLNFIPTIGSLVATLFPAIFSLIQFGEFLPAIMVIGLVGSIQVLVGNVLEPKVMGNTMNISPLVTIVALSFWGAIWGVTGMFLSVPIMVIFIIICSQFERTKPIAIVLSEKGRVE